MSKVFGEAFTKLVLDASGEASVSAFALARRFPKATLCRWASGAGEPRAGRREPLFLRVLESIGVERERRASVIDATFGADWGHEGGRARAARAKTPPAGTPISPVDRPPTASPEDPEPPSNVTDARPLLLESRRLGRLLRAALASQTISGDARDLVSDALDCLLTNQKKNWFTGKIA